MIPQPLDLINGYIKANSNLDTHRPYVGMSSINSCPRDIYNRYFNPSTPDDAAYRRSYQGYMYEREAKKILASTGLFVPGSEREIVASFDKRFKGHTEGEDCDGQLVEIKSRNAKRFAEIKASGILPHPLYWQVQGYMKHGKYNKCSVYIINTDGFEWLPIVVFANRTLQEKVDSKASEVLRAIDQKQPPKCLCNRCV